MAGVRIIPAVQLFLVTLFDTPGGARCRNTSFLRVIRARYRSECCGAQGCGGGVLLRAVELVAFEPEAVEPDAAAAQAAIDGGAAEVNGLHGFETLRAGDGGVGVFHDGMVAVECVAGVRK